MLAIRFFGTHAEYDKIDGERVMDATLVLIYSDAELLRARALVDQLWNSTDPADVRRCPSTTSRFAKRLKIGCVFANIPNSRPLRPELRSS